MDVVQTSYMMAFLGLGFALGMSGFMQWIMKKLTVKNMATLNWMLSTIIGFAVILAPDRIMMQMLLVPLGATLGASYGQILTLFSAQVSPDRQGWVMGITGAIGALAFGVVELTTTDLLLLGYAAPLVCGCILLFFATLGLFFWKPKAAS
jgi:hypothetical protein